MPVIKLAYSCYSKKWWGKSFYQTIKGERKFATGLHTGEGVSRGSENSSRSGYYIGASIHSGKSVSITVIATREKHTVHIADLGEAMNYVIPIFQTCSAEGGGSRRDP